ncbi:hypothetical protein ZOSMA_6G00300 [Zostera marina]|uniref:Uncharacterized protein n=1 Tax=Zostera marina TaxID=29655 RepID=A0A0K9NSU7_ZOSMR|nr:hypothetical protein ZOSMA_6G00300 [Zostera marina]
MAFLKFEPFSIKKYWQYFVQRPMDQGKTSGMLRLQNLHCGEQRIHRLIGRVWSDFLPRPLKSVMLSYLSSEERERNEAFKSDAQSVVGDYINSDTIMHNY